MRKILITVAMLLAGSGLALAPAAAHAASADATCTGTETVTYQPGLLLTAQQVHVQVTGILTACASSDPGIVSGTYHEAFSTSLSCSTLLAGRAGSRVFRWSNGQTSTFAFNRALNNVGGQTTVTFTGVITSGEFFGDSVLEQVVFITPNTLQCLAPPGLTQLGPGPAVLTIDRA